MKSISTIFDVALRKMKERNFPCIYVAIDIHGTILKPTRLTHVVSDGSETALSLKDDVIGSFYPCAVNCLKALSDSSQFKLILWTSGKQDAIDIVVALLEHHHINFDFVNENPDFKGNSYADFSKKFCFDILLDDKAGFDGENDWIELWEWLNKSGLRA